MRLRMLLLAALWLHGIQRECTSRSFFRRRVTRFVRLVAGLRARRASRRRSSCLIASAARGILFACRCGLEDLARRKVHPSKGSADQLRELAPLPHAAA